MMRVHLRCDASSLTCFLNRDLWCCHKYKFYVLSQKFTFYLRSIITTNGVQCKCHLVCLWQFCTHSLRLHLDYNNNRNRSLTVWMMPEESRLKLQTNTLKSQQDRTTERYAGYGQCRKQATSLLLLTHGHNEGLLLRLALVTLHIECTTIRARVANKR